MTTKRYVLAKSGEAMPFRGRLFSKDGEMMDPDEGFTVRLLAEGSIKEAKDPLPADLEALPKDELLAEAERRGVEVATHDTKARITAAIKGDK